MKWQSWLKIIILLTTLILLSAGFLAGYLYNSSCSKNPFIYIVEGLNKANNDDFTCSCSSYSGRIDPFSFDETGIKEDLDVSPNILIPFNYTS